MSDDERDVLLEIYGWQGFHVMYETLMPEPGPGDELDPALVRALDEIGVTPILARLIALHASRNQITVTPDNVADLAEAAALADLMTRCDVDPTKRQEMRRARNQARYARSLNVNYRYLVSTLRRDLDRLDRLQLAKRRHRSRPHRSVQKLSPQDNAAAERLWMAGEHHGLTWSQARQTRPRANSAVYRRVHRILKLVRSECQHLRT